MVKEIVRVRVYRADLRGKHTAIECWILAEHPIAKPKDLDQRNYYFACQLDHLGLDELVEFAHLRGVIERYYRDAKGELGLDHYEGPVWADFHRHVALVMLAHCYLTLRQSCDPEVIAPAKVPPDIQGKPSRPPPPARGFPPTGKEKLGSDARTGC